MGCFIKNDSVHFSEPVTQQNVQCEPDIFIKEEESSHADIGDATASDSESDSDSELDTKIIPNENEQNLEEGCSNEVSETQAQVSDIPNQTERYVLK